MNFIEQHRDQIAGVLSCYDRVLISGTVPGWGYAQGMTSFLYANGIKIFDYPKFANEKREFLRDHVENIAKENSLEIEFIRHLKTFRKEDRIQTILETRGMHPGLVHIFSAMEPCPSYQPWHDKSSHKNYLRTDCGKCLHYYFYFIDRTFGLCFLRVPTWCPFSVQFYFNGHNWLASELTKHDIAFTLRDNAFFSIGDFSIAQKLADSFRVEKLHKALDAFVLRYCPIPSQYGLTCRWNLSQVEYSTDIIFYKQSELSPIYQALIKTAIQSVKPENIATFLGRKLHPLYRGEMGNNFNKRILGTRIKHTMGAISIKIYDKYGIILRIETTVNDVTEFKCYRQVLSRNGPPVMKTAAMKKNIYSLHDLSHIMGEANRRYLELIATFDDPSHGVKNLNDVSKTVKYDHRTYKGFNFFNDDDQKLFEALARGEFTIKGFSNKSLRKQFPDKDSSTISRILKRLLVHHLIKRVRRTYNYYLTTLGKTVIITGLAIKEMIITPQLATAQLRRC